MTTTTTIDRTGRIIIPRPVREALRVEAGDELEIISSGGQLALRPLRVSVPLVKELGVGFTVLDLQLCTMRL